MPDSDSGRVVEGRIFDCPDGLAVAADCLGQTYRTVIGDQSLAITLPSLPDTRDSSRDASLMYLVAPEYHYEYPPARDDVEPIDWGMVTSAVGGEPRSALINELHYTFEITGADGAVSEACVRIGSDLASWWDRMSMWLDTYTGLDLRKHGHKRVLLLGTNFLAYTSHDAGIIRPVNWASTVTVSPPRMIEVPDRATLARCFGAAGAGAVLPTEWQYLRDARSWLNAGETRRAVIDACTASEIALANQVHHLLAGTDEVVIRELLLHCDGIADVAKLVRKFGGSAATASRKQIEEQLARVRNRAAHAGNEPDHEEASQALKAATAVVERVLPREGAARPVEPEALKCASAAVQVPPAVVPYVDEHGSNAT